jgi:uncharacterized protein
VAFAELPSSAAWKQRGARDGSIVLDVNWVTRHARVTGRSETGARELTLETDGAGISRVNGEPAAQLDGCMYLDREASAGRSEP